MREIKFRAWNKKLEIMYQNVHLLGTFNELLANDTYECMQFTGLVDKNGEEIYEGDLFQVAKNRIYIVKYFVVSEDNFEKAYGCFCLTIPDTLTIPIDEFAINNGEIIGNIYETPEILKP